MSDEYAEYERRFLESLIPEDERGLRAELSALRAENAALRKALQRLADLTRTGPSSAIWTKSGSSWCKRYPSPEVGNE